MNIKSIEVTTIRESDYSLRFIYIIILFILKGTSHSQNKE